MGCVNTKEITGNENPKTPSDISDNSIQQINKSKYQNNSKKSSSGATVTGTQQKEKNETTDKDEKAIERENNSTPTILQLKRPSLLSLSGESSVNDITVNIPDPFRSNYKVTDSLYHKNYRKLYRGIDKNRRDVLVEFTELRSYGLAGYTQIDYFNRIDLIRDLNHPSIPKVLDIYDGSEVNRVVFDYFPGKDLDCLLKMKGPLPPKAIKPFVLALVSIVQYIHSQKIIHRNISPSSIILAAFSSFVSVQQMRLTGLTRLVRIDENNLHHVASSGDTDDDIATKPVKQFEMDTFSAPELGTSQHSYGVDLYSIGGVLYNITTGALPPAAGDIDPLEQFSDKIWEDESIVRWGVKSLIIRLMSVTPQDRPGLQEIAESFNS